jgi:hypothetical protein
LQNAIPIISSSTPLSSDVSLLATTITCSTILSEFNLAKCAILRYFLVIYIDHRTITIPEPPSPLVFALVELCCPPPPPPVFTVPAPALVAGAGKGVTLPAPPPPTLPGDPDELPPPAKNLPGVGPGVP